MSAKNRNKKQHSLRGFLARSILPGRVFYLACIAVVLGSAGCWNFSGGSDEDGFSCMGLYYCVSCCRFGDQSCIAACEAIATEDAKKKIAAINSCLSWRCSNVCTDGQSDSCDACADHFCSSEMAACDWNPRGTYSCLGLITCRSDCPDTPLVHGSGNAATCPTHPVIHCANDCYGKASSRAVHLTNLLDDCLWDNCFHECQHGTDQQCENCFEAACPTQIQACANDY